MRAEIPELNVASVDVAKIDVGEIRAGPIKASKLTLVNVKTGIAIGSVRFKDVSVKVELELTIDWRVHVPIPFVDDIDEGGTVRLTGWVMASAPVDITVGGLPPVEVDIAELSVSNLNVVIDPLYNLSLGAALVERIQAVDALAPAQGFQLTGITLGRAEIEDVGVPALAVAETYIDRVAGSALPLGDVTIGGVALPQIALGDLALKNTTVKPTLPGASVPIDLGLLRLTVSVKPKVEVKIGDIELRNVRGRFSTDRIELQNLKLPYELFDIRLGQLGVNTIEIPKVEVS